MSASAKRVIVVGGGLAGLACSIKLGEDGVNVDLFSMVPVKRSHSVCAQGGINACNDIARQQGYSEWIHFDETVLGGDFLADQPPVLEMCNWAPRIIDLLDRMGVPFNRTPEGQLDLRLLADRSSSARSSPEPQPASKCSTPSTSKPADLKQMVWSTNTNSGNSSVSLFTKSPASASSRRTCAPCKSALSAPMLSSWPPVDAD